METQETNNAQVWFICSHLYLCGVHLSLDPAVWVHLSPAHTQTLCCVLQDKTLHPHSSQVYEWVPVNLTLGVMMDYCDAEDNVD